MLLSPYPLTSLSPPFCSRAKLTSPWPCQCQGASWAEARSPSLKRTVQKGEVNAVCSTFSTVQEFIVSVHPPPHRNFIPSPFISFAFRCNQHGKEAQSRQTAPPGRQGLRVAALTVAATSCGHFRLASRHTVSPWPPSPFCLWGGLAADHGSDPAPP